MIADPFPEISFIQDARRLEVEAIEGGRRGNQFSMQPSRILHGDEDPIGGIAVDDIQETTERRSWVSQYVPLARRAFEERQLVYPFTVDSDCISLRAIPGNEQLARSCAELSAVVGFGNKRAKDFEVRAFRALHRLLGGWAVCVGAPRVGRTGPKRGVARFREFLRPTERGTYEREEHARNGDYGLDAVWILGREWGGPLISFQAKNSPFALDVGASERARASDSLQEWFGLRLDKLRVVISVFAINTILTTDLKQRAFAACSQGGGYHVLDCVDILFAESRCEGWSRVRDVRFEL